MGKLVTIDCQYLRPQFAASFLLIEGYEALFIECNTTHALPHLLYALEREGLTPLEVKYLIVTHAHLDHAGGSSAFLKACPNAVLICHPRAAKHLMDPSRLVASAKNVYGEKRFRRLYGELESIPPEKVLPMEDGSVLVFGSRTLRFVHTAGHANHHFCVFDETHEGLCERVFTGDAFGLSYPRLKAGRLKTDPPLDDTGVLAPDFFIFPSTSPTGFDPVAARLSIQKIRQSGAKKAYLTHFGEVKTIDEAAGQLENHLDFSEKLLSKAVAMQESNPLLSQFCEEELTRFIEKMLHTHNIFLTPEILNLLSLDLELNAAGIVDAAVRIRNRMVH